MLKKLNTLWKSIGPGLVTGASDDDPSGIATYSQAGARFGLQTLWTALITLPLMIAVIEMCGRLSLETERGLESNLRLYYPKWLLYVIIALIIPATIFNIGADISGMGAVANLLYPDIPSGIFSLIFIILLTVSLVFFSYSKIAAILKWLCLVLIVYFIVPFMVKQDWKAVAWSTIVPQIEWSYDYLYILVAIIGTTISPYLFFWQSAMSLEHKNHRRYVPHKDIQIKEMRRDINIGMIVSNLVMFFIILTTGSVLFPAGIQNIETVEQAAQALKPLAGNWAYLLFALGVIGTGFLAIPVLAASLAYLLSEQYNLDGGIDKKWQDAKPFYAIMIGSIVIGWVLSLLDINPINFLILTALAYGLISPILIALILHMCNNKKIIGKRTNSFCSNLLGILALILNTGAAIALIIAFFI